MPLKIKRTGLDQYAPGGDARIRMLCIGGPGSGKTRMSSFWPRPIFANCEAGLASVADRKAAFVDIRNSREMLEFLNDLDKVCRVPYRDREFQTVVIDTLDTFQRKVKDEYMLAHPEMQSFRGFDAWGYLEAKTSATLTRLLNLDMNVIINVHYETKTIREGSGDNATERIETVLQLNGSVKDSIFNDFDLVGWLGTFWKAGPEGGDARVEARGLSFKRTPERPFLKDRLNVTPPWLEVEFTEDDYFRLFAAVIDRLDQFPETEDIREIEGLSPQQGGEAVTLAGGALPPQPAAQVPLSQLDKPSLQMKCREWAEAAKKFGLDEVAESLKFAGNTLKSELVDKLEKARPILNEASQKAKDKAAEPPAEGAATAPAETAEPPQSADSVASSATPEATPAEAETPAVPEPAVEAAPAAETPVAAEQPAEPVAEAAPVAAPETPAPEVAPAAETPVPAETAETVYGTEAVNTETGELPPAPEGATDASNVAHAAEALGAEVVSEPVPAEAPAEAPTPVEAPPAQQTAAPAPQAAPAPAGGTAGGRQIPEVCQREGCNTVLAGENQDYVKISFVKFRNFFCNKDFTEAKAAGKIPWPVKQTDAA